MNIEKSKNKIFLENFDFNEFDFFDVYEFTDCPIGFSAKKKVSGKDTNNATMISMYIPSRIYSNNKINQLLINTTFGKISNEGITMRQDRKLNEPVDAEFSNEYFYDVNKNKFYKKKKEVNANKILNEIYLKHIKPTKKFRGLFLRFKMIFWWVCVSYLFKLFSELSRHFLYFISGIKYCYEPILREEKINQQIIKSSFKDIEPANIEEVLKEGKKLKIFNYEASQWSIIFYSMVHLLVYCIFVYYNYYPSLIVKIIKNNFVTLVYTISSLWIIEFLIPKILMLLVKNFSHWSFLFKYKSLKL